MDGGGSSQSLGDPSHSHLTHVSSQETSKVPFSSIQKKYTFCKYFFQLGLKGMDTAQNENHFAASAISQSSEKQQLESILVALGTWTALIRLTGLAFCF